MSNRNEMVNYLNDMANHYEKETAENDGSGLDDLDILQIVETYRECAKLIPPEEDFQSPRKEFGQFLTELSTFLYNYADVLVLCPSSEVVEESTSRQEFGSASTCNEPGCESTDLDGIGNCIAHGK